MAHVGADEIVGAVSASGYGQALRAHGARTVSRVVDGVAEYRLILPRDGRAPLIIRATEQVQGVGGEVVSGKVLKKLKKAGKKLKKAAVKVAKSKVFKVVTKAAGAIGNVLPGPLGAIVKTGSKVMDVAVRAAAKGGAVKKALAPAVKAAKTVAKAAAPSGGVVIRAKSGKRYRVLPA